MQTFPPDIVHSAAALPTAFPSRRLIDLSGAKDALSTIFSVSGARTYRVTFERSGAVTFQPGLVGGYWLNRERVPSLCP
ncbi:MAG TPA: hypothetical protein VFO25_08280 [Candidatus Eremiobacteraceae bacterium]|nr:hypothetical protein [Candidatus Eremiobacteraceae bacterium]